MEEGKKHPFPEDFEVEVNMVWPCCIEAWSLQ
jgi:hypothetical protein